MEGWKREDGRREFCQKMFAGGPSGFRSGFVCFIFCFRCFEDVQAVSMSRVIDVALLLASGSKQHRGGKRASLFHPQLSKRTITYQRSMYFCSVSLTLGLVHPPSSSNFIDCWHRGLPRSQDWMRPTNISWIENFIAAVSTFSRISRCTNTCVYDGLCYIRKGSQMSSQTCRESVFPKRISDAWILVWGVGKETEDKNYKHRNFYTNLCLHPENLHR